MSEYRYPHIALLCAALLATAPSPAAVDDVVDPMRPAGHDAATARAASAVPVLSYTRVSAKHRQALIDGRLVEVGDTVAGGRVERIDRGRVHLRRGGVQHTLTLSARSRAPEQQPRPQQSVADQDSEHDQ